MKIEIKRSPMAGTVYAECVCGWKCHYWEDRAELEHECIREVETCRACDLDLATPGEIVDEYKLCHSCYCVEMDPTRR